MGVVAIGGGVGLEREREKALRPAGEWRCTRRGGVRGYVAVAERIYLLVSLAPRAGGLWAGLVVNQFMHTMSVC